MTGHAVAQVPAAWSQAREAHARSADAKSANALLGAFLKLDRTGAFNVGAAEASALELLGEPDSSKRSGAITRHRYGFLVLACRNGRVDTVMDARGTPPTRGGERLRFEPRDKREWRPGHRYSNRQRTVVEYVLPGERVQGWTQLVTHERYLGLAQRATAKSFVASIRKQLARLDPEHSWTIHAAAEDKLVYEWLVFAKDAKRAERELATVVFGEKNVHRLAFASKGAELDPDLRDGWLETMRGAKIAAATRGAKGAGAKGAQRSAITRRLAWELGSKLSLAAILASKGAGPELVARQLGIAKTMARGLGVEVPELPKLEGESSERYARVLAFLLKDMAPVADAVRERHGRGHSLLMSVAIKSNATLLLYNPKDDTGQAIAARAEKVCSELELPAALWKPAVESIRAREPFAKVKAAIFRMHQGVSAHLSPRRG